MYVCIVKKVIDARSHSAKDIGYEYYYSIKYANIK